MSLTFIFCAIYRQSPTTHCYQKLLLESSYKHLFKIPVPRVKDKLTRLENYPCNHIQAQSSWLILALRSKHLPGLEKQSPRAKGVLSILLLCFSDSHNLCPGDAALCSLISAAFGGLVTWVVKPMAPVVHLSPTCQAAGF